MILFAAQHTGNAMLICVTLEEVVPSNPNVSDHLGAYLSPHHIQKTKFKNPQITASIIFPDNT